MINKNNYDYICTCGHLKNEHIRAHVNSELYDSVCQFHIVEINFCTCTNYIQDNLSYLEKVYNDKSR
jgi:hypothetical protein